MTRRIQIFRNTFDRVELNIYLRQNEKNERRLDGTDSGDEMSVQSGNIFEDLDSVVFDSVDSKLTLPPINSQ